ncbi:MAG: DUF1330 domain-containing protein [Rhodobacteraceae bacterium]|nr:DUF1330 domain-containing protein [Paracoccaceae bacterium]
MSAYMSAVITIKDPEQFQEYTAKVRPMIAEHGGEPLMIGKLAKVLTGEAGHHFSAVFRFPDAAAIDAWYQSEAYQAIIPIRDAGADVVISVLQDL